jgi:hypothetical protein
LICCASCSVSRRLVLPQLLLRVENVADELVVGLRSLDFRIEGRFSIEPNASTHEHRMMRTIARPLSLTIADARRLRIADVHDVPD